MTSSTGPKRFYKTTSIEEAETGWAVLLDNRTVKTPARAGLILPSQRLAEAIAAEWDEQGERLDLSGMMLTRLANVAIDRTPEARDEMVEELTRYAETDLLCHLEDREPTLRQRQDENWGPWRSWAGKSLGIVLVPMEGIMASPQPAASLDAVREHARPLDDFRLTGLSWATALFGSVVLALGVEQNQLQADTAFKLSCLDEDFQAEQWGHDEEASQVRQSRANDAAAIGLWFEGLST